MAIEITSLDALSDADVEQAYALAQQLVLEKQPNVDTKRGVLGQLVLGLDAILGAAHRESFRRLQRSQSLLEITNDPTLADDDTVNALLSNYRLTRREAQAAKGEVTIVLNQNIGVTIAAGSVFVGNGQHYTADASYAARTDSANVLSSTDRLLVKVADDRYAFTINVTAVTPGSAGLLTKDTELTPLDPPVSFVQAYAASDFTGGLDKQTNADLIALMEQGIAARAYSNRTNIFSMLRNADPSTFSMVTTDFANILAISIVGFGDQEMLRDQHGLFPVSTGGRTDIYLRSQALPITTKLTKEAVLISKGATNSIWQFSIARDDAPGFYEIRKITTTGAPATVGGYEITDETRAVDLTGDDVPDIVTYKEGIYSRYQTAVVQFRDTDTDTSSLTVGVSKANYDITLVRMPLVKEVQQFIQDRRVRNPAGDHLVKAAMPCFVSLSFTLYKKQAITIDKAAIRTALATYVNNLGFAGRLYAAELQGIITDLLDDSVSVGAIEMFGRIRQPDGTDYYISDNAILTVPTIAQQMISARTVALLLDENDIGIGEVYAT